VAFAYSDRLVLSTPVEYPYLGQNRGQSPVHCPPPSSPVGTGHWHRRRTDHLVNDLLSSSRRSRPPSTLTPHPPISPHPSLDYTALFCSS